VRLSPLLVFLTATGLVLAAASAGANPDLRTRQSQAQTILAQVQALSDEVNVAAERFNGANYRLRQLSRDLRTTQRDLARARGLHRAAQGRLAERLVDLYKADEPSALEVILGAHSLEDVVDGLEARERVADQDSAIAEQVRIYRGRVAERAQRLRRARAEQALVVERRAAERAAIEAKLSERRRLLASVRAEVERLRTRERARQAELERRARADLATLRRGLSAAPPTRGVAPGAQRGARTRRRRALGCAGRPHRVVAAPGPATSGREPRRAGRRDRDALPRRSVQVGRRLAVDRLRLLRLHHVRLRADRNLAPALRRGPVPNGRSRFARPTPTG
jgi:peptidoglycan hydrolase CwlO-like protein